MQSSNSTGQKATDGRTETSDRARPLSVVTGKPQHADLKYVGTDADGSDHYHSELTESVRVVEDGEIVWFESPAARDAWIEFVREKRGWASLVSDSSGHEAADRTATEEAVDR